MSKPKEVLFTPEDTKRARLEFINAERREVIRDLRLVLGILIGIQTTLIFVSLVYKSPMGSPLNRIVYSLFLFSPWVVLYFIWNWNQSYYFDALGIRMILVELLFIEFISMGLLVFEILGGGTTIPQIINETISLAVYLILFFLYTGVNVFLVYLLLQTEERPYLPLITPQGQKQITSKQSLQPRNFEPTIEEKSEKQEGKSLGSVVKNEKNISDKDDASHTVSSVPSRPSIIKELKQPRKKTVKNRKKSSNSKKKN